MFNITEELEVISFKQSKLPADRLTKGKISKRKVLRLINLKEIGGRNRKKFDGWSIVSVDHSYINYKRCPSEKVCNLVAHVSYGL